jgi:diketogulonate reductase-like aldo/keto reductase
MSLPAFAFRDGTLMPRLGMGTWRMGERAAARADEVAALRLGLDLGMMLIDTAEMYGEGGAEEVVGEAIRGRRDDVFVVSKFYPYHASRPQLVRACEGSLKRLRIEALDLYLLHWGGSEPFAEMVETLGRLVEQGKIRRWGVSNLDRDELDALAAVEGGERVATDQVLYALAHRGPEFDLLGRCETLGIPLMAYSPLDQGALAVHPAVGAIARRLAVSAAQVALAWVLRHPGIVAIPKAARLEHVRANRAAADLALDAAALEALDGAFPPPRRRKPLEMV